MPPSGREAFRSAEWTVIQETIQNAVQATVSESNKALREDLKEFRTELKGDLNGLKRDVSAVQLQLSQGDGMFKLQEQRVKWLEDEHERSRASDERAGLLGDTTRIQRAIADARARDKTSDDSGKRRKDDRDRLLINPKVINAAILAFVAAAGASLWAVVEHAFAPTKPEPPTQSAPAVVQPTVAPTHSPLPGTSTGG